MSTQNAICKPFWCICELKGMFNEKEMLGGDRFYPLGIIHGSWKVVFDIVGREKIWQRKKSYNFEVFFLLNRAQ